MPKKCYIKPNRKEIRHWNEKAVGRVVAYARRDGGSDVILIAYILHAFGMKKMACVILKLLDLLNTGFFLAAVVGLFKSIALLTKGLKILALGKGKIPSSFLEAVVPKKFEKYLGEYFTILGTAGAISNALVIFLTAIANNLSLYLLMKQICQYDVDEANLHWPETKELELGDLSEKFDELRLLLIEWKQEYDEASGG